MTSIHRQDLVAILLGVVTALAWLYGFNGLLYMLIEANGLDKPFPNLISTIVGLSFFFGAVGASCMRALPKKRTFRSLVIFVAAVVSVVLLVPATFADWEAAMEQIRSYGFWSLLFGIVVSGHVSQVWRRAP